MKLFETQTRYASTFGLKMISSLSSPGYRLVFIASMCQLAATTMQAVTNPLLIFRLTGSPALLGVAALASAIPMIFAGLFGGAIADRISKKSMLIACYTFMALISLGIALALDTGHLGKEHVGSWWILILANAIQGAGMGLLMPPLMAIIPELVSRERLMNAIALNNLTMAVMSLAVPLVAGVLIDRLGFEAAYYVMTGLYGAAIIFFLLLHRSPVSGTNRGQILNYIADGFKYIRANPTVLFILVFSLTTIALALPYQQFLPIYADDIFHVDATGLGLMMSFVGVGTLIGSLGLTVLPGRKRGWLLLASGILAAAALGVFALSVWWYISLGMMVIMGVASALRSTISSTLVQSITDPAYMGRVMSLSVIQFGIMSVFTFLVGMLTEIVQIQSILMGMATILFVISLIALISNRGMRQFN